MPLTMAVPGEQNIIKKIRGKDDTRRFLESLGFVEGAEVKIITSNQGNVILNIKDTRVALSQHMAMRILI